MVSSATPTSPAHAGWLRPITWPWQQQPTFQQFSKPTSALFLYYVPSVFQTGYSRD
eukprot:m.358956 g.358956  ORF g.358956 m.358956 type:complete len:56 (+) comp16622_c0_seq11:845-1012(+)